MAKLHMSDSSGLERDYEIGPTPQVFGRGEDSDVVLGSRSVARHLMRVWDDDGKVMVEDLTDGQGLRVDGDEVLGTFELFMGSQMEAGVYTFSVPGRVDTAVDGEILEEAPPVPYLEGTKGPTKGLEVELVEGDNDVGRDPAVYLVINDPSVSRLHARITVDDDQFTLVDMRSSNGTFVNNKRIETASLVSGDFVRFGNLEFKFLCGEAASKGATALKIRRLLLVAAGSLLGIFLLIGIIAKVSTKDDVQEGIEPVEETIPLEVRVEQHLKAARGLMEQFEWKRAEKKVDQALDIHPISKEARRMKKKIQKEHKYKNIYDDGMVNYDLSKWNEALAFFRQVPPKSAYHKKVKYKIKDIVTKLTDYHLKEGKSYFTAQQYRNSQRHFISYMKLRPCDKKVYEKWIKKAEAKMRRFKIKHTPFEYNCTESQEAASKVDAKHQLDPEEVLRAAYPDKKLYDAVMVYYRGKAEVAIDALRRIAVYSDDSQQIKRAKELEKQLMIVDGKYSEGTSLLLREKLDDARKNFEMALATDAKLIPGGIRSFYHEDIIRQLTVKLYKLGLEEFNRKHWKRCFAHWYDCVQINPDGTNCMRGLNELERIANDEALPQARMYRSRGRIKDAINLWELVLKFTRPESLPHKKAQLALKEYR